MAVMFNQVTHVMYDHLPFLFYWLFGGLVTSSSIIQCVLFQEAAQTIVLPAQTNKSFFIWIWSMCIWLMIGGWVS